ncbi:MAG: carboxypeptidase-like regulatory domain-containing protein, partial [Bacteroidetes bacterium]|nr:carboxypeptidase-like regulatory domain-containing protein [Bacteroidota bacterium]
MKPNNFSYYKIIIILMILCCSSSFFAQENVEELKTISGKVKYLNTPLPNVNIIIKGTFNGTKTDTQGYYTIKAKTGDILQYSYVGFNTVSIIVEDVTTVLNIEMDTHVSELDEVVLYTRNKVEKVTDFNEVMDIDLQTSFGTINPSKSASAVHYLGNRSLRHISSPSLEDALSGRFSKVEKRGNRLYIRDVPAHFDIDGMLFERDPGIVFSNIEHLFIMKGRALVIIRTKNSQEVLQAKKKAIAEQHKNQNYYNNDAVAVQNETTFSSNTVKAQNTKAIPKNISGKVTYIDTPLANVNIMIVGKTIGTKTNTKGDYHIKANVGDIIQYSHLGFATVSIIIEDITEVLDIEMVIKENVLDQVTVTANGKIGKVLERAKKADKTFETSRGNMDPKSAGYTISFVDGDEVKNVYPSIKEALRGKITGYQIDNQTGKAYLRGKNMSITQDRPVAWEVDGVFTTDEPTHLDLSQIKSVHALKSLAATTKYGSQGVGGVIVVTTKYGSFDALETKRKKIAEQYTNKNYYSNDALQVNLENLNSSSYANALEAFNNKQKAFIYYDQTLKA